MSVSIPRPHRFPYKPITRKPVDVTPCVRTFELTIDDQPRQYLVIRHTPPVPLVRLLPGDT